MNCRHQPRAGPATCGTPRSAAIRMPILRSIMRRSVWLIWLCLALLPLRGMAHATMLAAGMPQGMAVLQLDAASGMPCPLHATVSDDALAAATPAVDGATAEPQNAHSCQLCDLCHSAALPMAMLSSAEAALPDAAPAAGASLGAGRLAPDGLFRPPR